ncbi:hypothetical protein M9H77_09599 [Catharanthus roseus]|uniref:Uncharacterized protein n=1 Tax=Catharanthus roseus TaxID=4058 RepID=A0ACC0C117_CATRO|nr:hypothetical protein M9H77_09599 [Catharanthus roseus]
MVKTKNAQVGQGQNPEEGGTSRGKGKRKRVSSGTGASAARALERFISVKEAARDIAFDDRLLNEILDTPQDGIRFYTKNKKCFDPNLYSEKRFAKIFTRGESSITNMHAFVMLALHEHRRMNFGYMAIEHMLATQSFSTKCLPHGGQDDDDNDEEDDDEDQEDMDMEEEDSDEETEVEIQRRETRQKKRQERTEEGLSSGSMNHLMDMIASLQTSINTRFDAFDSRFEVLDGKVSNIQERLDALDQKMTDTQERVKRLEQGGGDGDD